jgi:hypothetical protein
MARFGLLGSDGFDFSSSSGFWFLPVLLLLLILLILILLLLILLLLILIPTHSCTAVAPDAPDRLLCLADSRTLYGGMNRRWQ